MQPSEFVAAVKRGDLDAARSALGRNPGLAAARDDAGVSVICLAVYVGHTELAAELARARTDLDIFEASCIGDRARVEELLTHEPRLVNSRSPDGFQPLGYACFFGRSAVFETLVVRGAELDAPSDNAMRVRPIHSAVAHADAGVALSLARRLLELGASPNVRQQGGFTPLHEAALRGDAPLVSLLLRHGADPSARNEADESAADLAQRKGHAEIAQSLRTAHPKK